MREEREESAFVMFYNLANADWPTKSSLSINIVSTGKYEATEMNWNEIFQCSSVHE